MSPGKLGCAACGWNPAGQAPRFCKKCGKAMEPVVPKEGAATSLPSAGPDPLIGQLLDGRYRVRELLGQGGMGRVYRVEHMVLKQHFALKCMHEEFIRCSESRQRFRREAKLAAKLFHPHSVAVHNYWEDERGQAFLLMEFLKGTSLAAYVARLADGCIPTAQAVEIALPIAQVLAHAHAQGIVHRDIKPSNVWLTQHIGRLDHVKVLDFGLARAIDDGMTQDALRAPGTLGYMAPELLRFDHSLHLTASVDIYALGILLFEIISGQMPFSGSNEDVMQGHKKLVPPHLSTRRRDPAIGRELDQLVAAMLGKLPKDRPTAASVVAVLEKLQLQLPAASVRGLLVQQTVLRTQALQDRDFHSAETKILSPRIYDATTALPKLRELDVLDAQLEQISGRMAATSSDLLRRAWGKDRPRALSQLESEIEELLQDCRRQEQQLSLGKLSLQEKIEQAYGRCRNLQEHLMDLREAARAQAPGEVREKLWAEVAHLEQELSDMTPVPMADPDLRERQQIFLRRRQDLLDKRRRFAVGVLRQFSSLALSQSAAWQEIAEDLERALAKYDNLVTSTAWAADPDPAPAG